MTIKIDFVIKNDGTLEDLHTRIDNILDELPQKPEIFNDNTFEII